MINSIFEKIDYRKKPNTIFKIYFVVRVPEDPLRLNRHSAVLIHSRGQPRADLFLNSGFLIHGMANHRVR